MHWGQLRKRTTKGAKAPKIPPTKEVVVFPVELLPDTVVPTRGVLLQTPNLRQMTNHLREKAKQLAIKLN
jgi:hypothetical protein